MLIRLFYLHVFQIQIGVDRRVNKALVPTPLETGAIKEPRELPCSYGDVGYPPNTWSGLLELNE